MKQITKIGFQELFLKPTHWIDVRAPIEFREGSIPGALNLPLLNDEERHQVGLTYKTSGQEAAIKLGHQLVSGSIRESRTQTWIEAIQKNLNPVVFCFRGGLRSQTVQAWLQEQQVTVPIIEGGYKALRRFLLETIEEKSHTLNFKVVCGPTGSGKTHFLRTSGAPFLDLESVACHRGSAFGAMTIPQPNQVNFENQIAVELLRLADAGSPIYIEDESRLIGKRLIPDPLFAAMKTAPRLYLDVSLAERVETIFKDYILDSALGTQGDLNQFAEFRRAINAISQRLGGLRTKELLQDLDHCQAEFEKEQRLDANRIWIEKLLTWYYDPSYQHGISREN